MNSKVHTTTPEARSMPLCATHDRDKLIGILLTLVDSWTEDNRVAKARKDTLKGITYDWYEKLQEHTANSGTQYIYTNN